MTGRKIFAVIVFVLILIDGGYARAWQPFFECREGLYSRWLPTAIPVRYGVNPEGSGRSETELLAVIQECFDKWWEPCCSGARTQAEGTTTLSPTNNGDGHATVGFLSGNWPRDFGDAESTLAITMPQIWSDCHISEMDIVFNEVLHDFCYESCGAWETPFEVVATHEMGHFLGLGHSANSDALMYHRYHGNPDTSLRADDVAGICSLYPDDHCQCSGPEECDDPLECVDGVCVPPDPCVEVTCEGGERCVGGTCLAEECGICIPCEDNGLCGANGQCIDRGDGEGRCVDFCGPAGSCPGDSVCFRATGGGDAVYLCLNPDAGSEGICHDGYECRDCALDGCGPGEQCFDGACRHDPSFVVCIPTDEACTGCPGAAEGCVEVTGVRHVCTVRCVGDTDCGECGACIDTEDPRVRVCVNHDHEQVGECPLDWACSSDGDGGVDGDADRSDGCTCSSPRTSGAPSVLWVIAMAIGTLFLFRGLRS